MWSNPADRTGNQCTELWLGEDQTLDHAWVWSTRNGGEWLIIGFWEPSPNGQAGTTTRLILGLTGTNDPFMTALDGNLQFTCDSTRPIDGGNRFARPRWAGDRDLAGEPRFQDGDLDGFPEVDLGAYEGCSP